VEGEVEFVLVAGHAVSVWANKYLDRSQALMDRQPFVSKDLDLLCASHELTKVAKLFPGLKTFAWRRDMPLLAVATTLDDRQIDFLRDLNGIIPDHIFANAPLLKLGGLDIRVIDPFTLFQAKACNVATIQKEGRNDAHQLQTLAHVIPCFFQDYIRDAINDHLPERFVIKQLKMFMLLFENTSVIKGCCMAQIDLPSLFPLAELASSDLEKCPRFLENTLTPWLVTTEKILNPES